MFKFRYRYVPFGINFGPVEERVRSDTTARDKQRCLLINEIVADVGGECFGYSLNGKGESQEGEPQARMVFDHHFQREAQFPSAAAAVLHHTAEIKGWSKALPLSNEAGRRAVWLVTHETPDFDALCSLYLIRKIIEGEIPDDGWEQYGIAPGAWTDPGGAGGKIEWFDPRVSTYDEKEALRYVWPLLLAAYASRIDNSRPVGAPRTRALHSVLYAGMKRGRSWEQNGAIKFFDAVVHSIREHRLNPLIDDTFADAPTLAPELSLLDGEEQRYLRDLNKARKTIVSVQVAQFEQWFPQVSAKPLLDEEGSLHPDHLLPGQASGDDSGESLSGLSLRQFDGIYIRDPESLLFKEWARTDQEHSPMGNGFAFTAVAYSRWVRNSDSDNTSRYFFALDPERVGNAHLYNVWAHLQAEEMSARGEFKPAKSRSGFERREVGMDPWYDGNNYRATIVDTPRAGTQIELELKDAPDLSDDRVAEIVERELEYASFGGRRGGSGAETQITLRDFCAGSARRTSGSSNVGGRVMPEHDETVMVAQAIQHPLKEDALRFVAVPLSDANLSSRLVATEIGRKIWPFLEEAGIRTVPTDFLERHLISHPHYVAVWNRNGIAIAHTERGQEVAYRVERDLEEFAEILRQLRQRASGGDARSVSERIQKALELKKQIVSLKMEAATPEMLPFRRLLESRRFEALLTSLQALDHEEFHTHERRREQEQKQRDDRLQAALAVVAVLGLLFAWNQIEQIQIANIIGWEGAPLARLLIGVVIAVAAVGVPLALLWRFRKRS